MNHRPPHPTPATTGGDGSVTDADARPTVRRELVSATVRGRSVVFDPTDRRLYELREDAAALWPLLDGGATVAELRRDLADAGELSLEAAGQLLEAILRSLRANGLIALRSPTGGASRG